MENTFLFTSESVGEGHPDKICDQISDAILDECMRQDPLSRVAVDVATKTGMILIMGEITTKATVDYQRVARDVLRDIGYTDSSQGLDYKTCNVLVAVEGQSADISQGLERDMADEYDLGAGDQGIMFGYATDETEEMMPMTTVLAHRLTRALAVLRKEGGCTFLGPDCKSQVTVEYAQDGGRVVPLRVHTVVVSTQHAADVDTETLRDFVMEQVVRREIPGSLLDAGTIFHIQPSGRFVIGGPQGDSGLTGRKIIVDSYGGWGAHGGGAFSGKDWSKVDRSGAYAMRWIAKSLVASGMCKRVLLQVSYAIGKKDPLSLHVDTYGTSALSSQQILRVVKSNFNLRLSSIVRRLSLAAPVYRQTATYGHFGRKELPWEVPAPIHGAEDMGHGE